MRRKRPDLQHYTWDQAQILALATSRAFRIYGFSDSTIRLWAKQGHITPTGIGPNGSVLYQITEVITFMEQSGKQPRTRATGT